MSERTCVCGHVESEHEEVANVEYSGQLVCMHEMKSDEHEGAVMTICPCMNFEPERNAEAAKA